MKKISLILIVILLFLFGCTKEDFLWDLPRENPYDGQINDTSGYQVPNRDAPKVNTGSVSNTTESTSSVSGDITSLGSSQISSYGHCWSLNQMPTINDAITNLGSINSTGIFSSSLIGLTPNTTYRVRAYATNSYGTSYGNQVMLTTQAILCDFINCESLIGFNHDGYGPSTLANWSVGTGYVGNGFVCPNAAGGFVEFTKNFTNNVKMTLWIQSWDPGFWQNLRPKISIDGIIIQTSVIAGNDNADWIQLKSNNTLFQGQHTIKIEFPQQGTFRTYYIDEIEFWCQ